MHIQTSDQEALQLGIGKYSCNWGTHICGLYETERERDEIIFGFLKEGLLNNDLQMYCPVEQTEEEFHQGFAKYCPQCDGKHHNRDHFSISSAKELYYPTGKFDPWHMDEALNEFYQQSQGNGKRNVRATAEMVWALEAIPGIEYLMAYEARLNYFIPGKPWISICMYNVNKFDGATIMNVLRTHPYAISGGIITQNPYFIHPDKWLADNAPQFLQPKV
ncbi:MAG: MEDS domain-containing protein [Prolixibacteraceae bacterium]